MNKAHERMLRYFKYEHLPDHLQAISKPFCVLAAALAAGELPATDEDCSVAHLRVRHLSQRGTATPPDDAEITVALRKLLEAKDAAVRAFV